MRCLYFFGVFFSPQKQFFPFRKNKGLGRDFTFNSLGSMLELFELKKGHVTIPFQVGGWWYKKGR